MSEETKRRVVKPQATDVKSTEAPIEYPPTDEALFSSKKNYDAASKDLIEFVEAEISKMRSNILFDEAPSFWQLNQALASYESILLALLASYASARVRANVAQEAYDDEWAAAVMNTKAQYGLSKYVSGKELEYAARVAHMEKLSKLKADVIQAENARSFVERLVDGWRQYCFVLSRLSANAEAEARASGVSTNDRIGEMVGEQANNG